MRREGAAETPASPEKIMKTILRAIFLLSVCLSPALARIGETLDQCQQRYGVMVRVESEFRPDYPQYVYQKGNVEIRVRLYNGLSAQEIFCALSGKLEDAQRQEIILSNEKPHIPIKTDFDYSRPITLIITTVEFDKVWRGAASTGF